jgi:hypothetical protein
VEDVASLSLADLAGARYVEFGWGDRAFYQAASPTLSMALRPMLWSTEAVLHVVALPGPPAQVLAGADVVELAVTRTQLARLVAFVEMAFARQPARRLRSAVAVTATARRSARLEGFSLHADVAVRAGRRDQLERLVRYLVRPPLALDRLTESTGGRRCTTSGVPGRMAPRRSCWSRWNCWSGSPPSSPRPGDRCWRGVT